MGNDEAKNISANYNNILEQIKQIQIERDNCEEDYVNNKRKNTFDYKKTEQNRLLTIIYGTALANVFSIYQLGKDPNIVFYITSLAWILNSYFIWIYLEKFVFQYYEIGSIIFLLNHKFSLEDKGKDLQEEKLNLANLAIRLNDSKLYNKIIEDQINTETNIKNSMNELKKYSEAITQYTHIFDLSQKMVQKMDLFYILALLVSWILGFTGIIYSLYMDMAYLPKFWGDFLIIFSAISIIGLWIYLWFKDKKIKEADETALAFINNKKNNESSSSKS